MTRRLANKKPAAARDDDGPKPKIRAKKPKLDTQPIGEHALDEASQRASIRKQMPEAPAPGAPAPGAPAAAQGVGSANDAREVEQESASEVSQRAREVEQENASEASQRAREVERSQKPTTEGQGQQSNEKKENTEISLLQSSV